MNISDLPVFEDVDTVPRIINSGEMGKIVLINYPRGLVAKVLDNYTRGGPYYILESDLLDLRGEYNVQRFFYEHDISVPKPEGVFAIPLLKQFGYSLVPALVMEYVDGVNFKTLVRKGVGLDTLNQLRDLYAEEKRKVEKIGCYLADHSLSLNSLYQLNPSKTVLTDFGRPPDDEYKEGSVESHFGLSELQR